MGIVVSENVTERQKATQINFEFKLMRKDLADFCLECYNYQKLCVTYCRVLFRFHDWNRGFFKIASKEFWWKKLRLHSSLQEQRHYSISIRYCSMFAKIVDNPCFQYNLAGKKTRPWVESMKFPKLRN